MPCEGVEGSASDAELWAVWVGGGCSNSRLEARASESTEIGTVESADSGRSAGSEVDDDVVVNVADARFFSATDVAASERRPESFGCVVDIRLAETRFEVGSPSADVESSVLGEVADGGPRAGSKLSLDERRLKTRSKRE